MFEVSDIKQRIYFSARVTKLSWQFQKNKGELDLVTPKPHGFSRVSAYCKNVP